MSLTPERALDWLPKWAQRHIRELTRERDEARRALELAHSGDQSTAYLRTPGSMDTPNVPLGEHARVRFTVGGPKSEYWFDAHMYNGYLLVRGNRDLAITPRASNTVELREHDRRLEKR